MVKKMNKTEFIDKLKSKMNLTENESIIVNDILENHFLIGKNNKEKIIDDLINRLNINELKANEIYNTSMSIISNELKYKLKHPFKSQN